MATSDELMQNYQQAYDEAQKYNKKRTWVERSWLGQVTGAKASGDQKQALLNSYMTNAFNSAEAQKNREFQEYMSNTAYQRSAKDLNALGFSNMALLSPSSSATVPSGSSTSASPAPVPDSGAGTGIISSLVKVIGILAGKPSISNVSIGSKKSVQSFPDDGKSWEQILDELDAIKN